MARPTRARLTSPVDHIRLAQDVERLVEHLVRNLAAVDIEPGEEHPVENGPHRLPTALIQGGRVSQQLQRRQEHLTAGLQLRGSRVELPRDLRLFLADGCQLGAELVLGPTFLGCQVQEVALLAVQLVELGCELRAQLVAQLEVLDNGRVDARAHGVSRVFR
ncbi:hypothetical protein [Amycolatopsis tolypomycina]|uniref:hypothetical protein n=1 Tax=Amycolatopsis tolypomycina TaxID=208445 RepID=UPI0033BC421D